MKQIIRINNKKHTHNNMNTYNKKTTPSMKTYNKNK